MLLVLLACGVATAQDGGLDSPLHDAQGVRALGMGGAAAAWLEEPSAIWWNAAALSLAPVRRLELQHTENAVDTRTEQFALVFPTLDYGAWAVGGGIQSTSDIVVTDPLSPLPQGVETFNRFRLGAGYGVRGPWGSAVGGTLKIVGYRFMGLERAAWGLDFGLLPVRRGPVTVGVAIQNLVPPTFSYADGLEDRWPRRGVLGLAARGMARRLLASAQVEAAQHHDVRFRLGAEYAPAEALAIRLGYNGDAPTFGGAIRYQRFRIDYAFVSPSDLGSEHRFGISIDLGTPVETQRAARASRLDREVKSALTRRAEEVEQSLVAEADQAYRAQDWETATRLYSQLELLTTDNPTYRDRVIELERRRDSLARVQIDLAVQEAAGAQRDLILRNAYEQQMAAGQWAAASEIALNLRGDERLGAVADSLDRLAQDSLAAAYERALWRARTALGEEEPAAAGGWARVALLYRPGDGPATSLLRRAEVQSAIQRASAALLGAVAVQDTSGVLSCAQDLLALDPQHPEGQKYLRDFAPGTDALKTTIGELQADAEAWGWYTQGFVEFRAGRYEQAIEFWNRVAERYPSNEAAEKNIEQARLRLQSEKEGGDR